MEEKVYTPHLILSNQIEAYSRDFHNVFCNKIVNSEVLAASNIKKAFYAVTARQIDCEPEYRALILAIMIQETGFRYHKKLYLGYLFLKHG